jgi:hypothetical protein
VADHLYFIRDRNNLRHVFLEHIGTSKDSAVNLNKFIVVDDVFGSYTKRLAEDEPDDQMETIAALASSWAVR